MDELLAIDAVSLLDNSMSRPREKEMRPVMDG